MKTISLLDYVRVEICKKYNIDKDILRFLKITSKTNRGIITLFLFEGSKSNPSFFVKASNRTNSKEFIRNEFVALDKLSKVSSIVPISVSFFERGSFSVLITEFIKGKCLAKLRIGTKPIKPSLLGKDLCEINEKLFETKICYGIEGCSPLTALCKDIKRRCLTSFGKDDWLVQGLNKIDEIFSHFLQTKMGIYFNHGDFAIGHLITDGIAIKGIVDWEYFGKIKLPFFDIFYCYITYYLSIIDPAMNISKLDKINPIFLDFRKNIEKTFGVHLKKYFRMHKVPCNLIYLFFFYSIAESLLRVKTIIGVPKDDPRGKFLNSFFANNLNFFLEFIYPQLRTEDGICKNIQKEAKYYAERA